MNKINTTKSPGPGHTPDSSPAKPAKASGRVIETRNNNGRVSVAGLIYGGSGGVDSLGVRQWNLTKESTQKQLSERLELVRWDTFCELVTKAYEEAPRNDPKAHPSYEALRQAVLKFFAKIGSQVRVEWVQTNPYETSEQMQAEVKKSKVLKIMTEFSDHPFFSEEENWKFRAVHDWFSHIIAKQPFSQKGEIQAYNTHVKMFPKAALPALFTEVVGQVCYNTSRGGAFPEQKVAILPGFDYEHLGRVEGWRIEKKSLVRENTYTDKFSSYMERVKTAFTPEQHAQIKSVAGAMPHAGHWLGQHILHLLETDPEATFDKALFVIPKYTEVFNYIPDGRDENLSLEDMSQKIQQSRDENLTYGPANPGMGTRVLYRSDLDYAEQTAPEQTWAVGTGMGMMEGEHGEEIETIVVIVKGPSFFYVFHLNKSGTELIRVDDMRRMTEDIPLSDVAMPPYVREKFDAVVAKKFPGLNTQGPLVP